MLITGVVFHESDGIGISIGEVDGCVGPVTGNEGEIPDTSAGPGLKSEGLYGRGEVQGCCF